MTFDDVLEQVVQFLQRQGRVSYRALKRRLTLDNGLRILFKAMHWQHTYTRLS